MSDFIKEQVKKLRKSQIQPIKSKVMFNWDFEWNIKILLEKLWEAVEKQILPNYKLDYINFSNASLKVKVNDKEKMIEKLITFNLAYHNMDKKFGYIDPQFLSDEISQKTRIHNLWRFLVTDYDTLINAFIRKLIFIIEEY